MVTNLAYAVWRVGVQRFGLEVAGEVMPRRPEISRLSRSRVYLDERIGMVRSAGVFAIGAQLLAKVRSE